MIKNNLLKSATVASLLAIVGWGGVMAIAGPNNSNTLTVMLKGAEVGDGKIYVGVYNSKTAYETYVTHASKYAVNYGGKSKLSFDLEDGVYAIRIFQDLNGDGVPNFNSRGAPIEPVAFSNNASMEFGPANWDAASFVLQKDGTQALALIRFDAD